MFLHGTLFNLFFYIFIDAFFGVLSRTTFYTVSPTFSNIPILTSDFFVFTSAFQIIFNNPFDLFSSVLLDSCDTLIGFLLRPFLHFFLSLFLHFFLSLFLGFSIYVFHDCFIHIYFGLFYFVVDTFLEFFQIFIDIFLELFHIFIDMFLVFFQISFDILFDVF
ncbi:hypothetical protein DBV05_g9838 [Lasiodiplodia theobromae]|uniref:Uncharacterized protein n=1 Tax=Lasiodiplodia theobromae TaxID=45133 RepID=A0A5N5D256_9PEZI|nr:hypothetical protein DBV05_g9838 [Lasiodiplodia theobromae]